MIFFLFQVLTCSCNAVVFVPWTAQCFRAALFITSITLLSIRDGIYRRKTLFFYFTFCKKKNVSAPYLLHSISSWQTVGQPLPAFYFLIGCNLEVKWVLTLQRICTLSFKYNTWKIFGVTQVCVTAGRIDPYIAVV